jgi:hypothetical protein
MTRQGSSLGSGRQLTTVNGQPSTDNRKRQKQSASDRMNTIAGMVGAKRLIPFSRLLFILLILSKSYWYGGDRV